MRDTVGTARALSQAVDAELNGARSAVLVLSKSPELAAGDLRSFYDEALHIVQALNIDNIVLSDVRGQQLINTLRPFGEPLPLHEREQLQRVIATGQPVISDLFMGAVRQKPIIIIEAPVLADGKPRYALAFGIFPERLSEILRRQRVPSDWVAAIVDSSNTIVARTVGGDDFIGKKASADLMERFQFLDKQDEFDSIHPSLLRQSKLNNNYGLYEVIPGIYQVRGFDLSDISFVRGKTGWIVFDPLVTKETARAAWKLFQQHVGQGLPVSAVIYSHTHGDHWGGVRGIVDEADVRSGKVPVIAPVDFMNFTISENVYAGNAMNRRLFYQYGLLLPASPHGYVGQGLGQAVSSGAIGLIAPNRYVEKPIEEFEVDGVRMIFQNTPNTEAPREMNTYIPGMKALWMAENVIASLHNIYTLRGAPVRDPLNWSKYIGEALFRFGLEAEVMFASHHWPRWGNERIQEVLRGQRDLYAHMAFGGGPLSRSLLGVKRT